MKIINIKSMKIMNTTFSNDQINLVIGYGDKKKSDEGAGCHVAEMIEQQKLENIEAVSVRNLTPSLASLIVQAKIVIFISTYYLFENMQPEIVVRHFLANHQLTNMKIEYPDSPSSLLSFANSTYDNQPNAFWIQIPATNHYKGSNFSSSTQQAIADTIDYLKQEKILMSTTA
jgi:Ni,Fe-hydrogenase maturation factor